MPRFTMCNDLCPIRQDCQRSEASGTVPSQMQSWAWFLFADADARGVCHTFRRKRPNCVTATACTRTSCATPPRLSH